MWYYNNEPFNEADINDYIGFVYIIHNTSKDKYYIGKKNFFKTLKRKPLKGKKRIRKEIIHSDWKTYCGSSAELLADIEGGDQITKTILKLCKSSSGLTYMELSYQLQHDALIKDNYYNGIINVRLSSVCVKNILKEL